MHWDTTIEENAKWEGKFFGDIKKKVSFPDILVLSETKKRNL